MIDLYFWPTQNGRKIAIFLEEVTLPYRIIPVNIRTGEQLTPEFAKISPNSKIPAIVDQDGPHGNPISLFESGAILLYLAEKTGRLMPNGVSERYQVIKWLMFQMATIGPMIGQQVHFRRQAPERLPYAIDRYTQEAHRLISVLESRLGKAEFLADDYSIADIATYPWMEVAARHNPEKISEAPNLGRWLDVLGKRPAVIRAMSILQEHARLTSRVEKS